MTYIKNFIRKNKNYIILIVVITLFFMSSIFRLIPILLFDITPDASPTTKALISLFSNFLVFLLLIIIYRKTLVRDIKEFKNNFTNLMEPGIKYWLTGLFIMMVSNIIISIILSGQLANNEQNVRNMLQTTPFITFFMTSILAPVTEELVFRKSFRDVIHNKWIYVLTSGIVFGGLHVILSLNSSIELVYLIPYCSLGIAFSYMYYETKNIMVPITIHMFHNAVLSILSILTLGMILW